MPGLFPCQDYMKSNMTLNFFSPFFFFLIKIILYFDRDYHLVFVDVTVNVYSVIIWQAFVIRQTPWYILECNGV